MDTPQDIVSRLKFIGRVKMGEKINTRDTAFVQKDHVITSISRTFWNKDDRTGAFSYVSETIVKALSLLNAYKSSSNETEKILVKNLLVDLKQAKIGMVNLKETYKHDLNFVCLMDTLLQSLDSHLIPFTKLIEQDLYSNSNSTFHSEFQPEVLSTSPASHVNIAVSTRTGMIEVQRGSSTQQHTPLLPTQPQPQSVPNVVSPITQPIFQPTLQHLPATISLQELVPETKTVEMPTTTPFSITLPSSSPPISIPKIPEESF